MTMGALESYSVTSSLFLSIIAVIEIASGSSTDKPMYVQVFATHQHWEGTYLYNSSLNYCYMFVHSEHYLKKDMILATFRDRHGTTVELEGEAPGQNELEVKFTVHVMFHHANRFPVNFTLQGFLSQDHSGKWLYTASMTLKGLFGPFVLQEGTESFGPPHSKDNTKAGKYFVMIGLPIILAVIGVAGTIALIYWAVKKGYIRHVPKSYDSFHNPVRFDNNENQEQGNVHI